MLLSAISDLPQILVRRATPALFAIIMGTGAISVLFTIFPYTHGSSPMITLSLIIFFTNLFLFTFFSVLVIAKYVHYPQKWSSLLKNPVTSLYCGCYPMGATTLINIAVEIIHARFHIGGKGFLYFLWAMWWLDVLVSFICCWVGLHFMFTYQKHSLQSMTAMWLLPVVTLIVASSTGGVMTQALQPYSASYALLTIVVSVFMVSVGLSLALMILTIYLLRLITYGIPPGGTVLSVFLPLGPTGQSGYAALLIGQGFGTLFPPISGDSQLLQTAGGNSAGIVLDIVCTCIAFILWSLATMWIIYALLAIYSGLRSSRIVFRVNFWGLIFPNGVYATLTIQLANAFDSAILRAWGSVYAVGVFILWVSVALRSLWEMKTFVLHHHPSSGIADEKIDEFEQQFERRWIPPQDRLETMSTRSLRSAGYQPLQSHEDGPDIETEPRVQAGPSRASVSQRRQLRPGSIDLTKLDNAFKRWTESIAQKVKRKKKTADHSKKQIWRSVFEPSVLPVPNPGFAKTLDHKAPMTQADFDALVRSVKEAINEGIHPKMITKGSSGSYFARAKVEGKVQTVAHSVFKPKDEEPYGRLNPKTTKWLHRQFRWIIPFGRACLIPNLSYISEAAASLLDNRLDLHIVPPTQLVSLSSPAFFYDWFDRNAAKKGKPLPEKIGSMQYFLHGFQDASEFLRKYPWPGRAISDTFDDSTHRHGNMSKRFMSALKVICGKTGDMDDITDDDDYEDERVLYDVTETSDVQRPFYWSQQLQQSFREELEKLVILDYLMLNTDRGADNYMIKYCEGDHEKTLVDVAPSRSVRLEMPVMSELRRTDSLSGIARTTSSSSYQPTLSPVPSGSNSPNSDYRRKPHIHIAAIDNSLSFPHEHPQGWRSYTYGWLYLPVSIIGRPFSEKTRSHFLPLLTSKAWWEETTFQLEKLFAVDPDFHPKMFARQLAVIKGQAWNIVQSLRHTDEGPLELTRRTKVLVWDEEMEIADDVIHDLPSAPVGPGSPQPSVSSVPLPKRVRSQSTGGEFPPPMRRTSTDATGAPRPVPFAAKFQRVHPGTTGVTVLEHLERLDAVEASLQRLGVDDSEETEEVDVGEVAAQSIKPPNEATSSTGAPTSPFSPPGSPLPAVQEIPSARSSIDEEDLVALSKSTSHVEGPYPFGRRNALSSAGMEWIQSADTPTKRIVISERLETVKTQPLCSCW
ncbi:hypothetical protein CVT26_013727 [Gymnopilus dilepis]|uniref:1-phosphatidylinositol 4-kinase n=1 Tax=Gymnopilus dilepis TaxID=231916 RepID=A0A409YWP6_9AGAR|nr:hypothetical protein CVT26_013727 [Gymnopilus dilepis]